MVLCLHRLAAINRPIEEMGAGRKSWRAIPGRPSRPTLTTNVVASTIPAHRELAAVAVGVSHATRGVGPERVIKPAALASRALSAFGELGILLSGSGENAGGSSRSREKEPGGHHVDFASVITDLRGK